MGPTTRAGAHYHEAIGTSSLASPGQLSPQSRAKKRTLANNGKAMGSLETQLATMSHILSQVVDRLPVPVSLLFQDTTLPLTLIRPTMTLFLPTVQLILLKPVTGDNCSYSPLVKEIAIDLLHHSYIQAGKDQLRVSIKTFNILQEYE